MRQCRDCEIAIDTSRDHWHLWTYNTALCHYCYLAEMARLQQIDLKLAKGKRERKITMDYYNMIRESA